MKTLYKKTASFFLIQFILIITLFSQENQIKDSLTIDETWKLLSKYEQLSFDEGMEIIYHIKYDQNDTIQYKLVTDSIFNLINKPFYLSEIRNHQIIDSLIKIVRDTLKFTLEINQKSINDYKNIHFYISNKKDNNIFIQKLQTLDNLIVLPSHNQVFDSVYIIIQYKEIYLNIYQHSYFSKLYHLKKLIIIHETNPYTNLFTNWNVSSIRELARNNKSEGFLYVGFDCFGDPCTSAELLIPDIKKYYKYGKQLVRNK